MIDRIKNILLSPKTEWPRIAAEPMTVAGIYKGWVVPLAAIGPVCSFIGGQLFSHLPLAFGLTMAVLGYVLSIAGVWLIAFVVNALAPSFDGTKDEVAATKLVAFSYTASFVGGVFGLIPMLAIISLLFLLYGFYLFYVGAPIVMRVPEDKAIGYTVVVVISAIVVYFVIGALVASLAFSLVGNPALMAGGYGR